MKLSKLILSMLLIANLCACRRTMERAEPLKYLNIASDYHTNLIGQTVIEGQINNKATAVTYKDIVVQISYLSETNAVLGTEDKTFYVFVQPKIPFSFKIKTDAPDQTATVSLKIIGAKPE